MGKVLLAHRHWNEVTHLFEHQKLQAFTPNTTTSFHELTCELEQIRKQDYAIDHEEVVQGLYCVAAPIGDLDGSVIAAISLSVPSYRFQPQQGNYLSIILKASQRISENLGYRVQRSVRA